MRGELIAACHSWAAAAGSPLIRPRAGPRAPSPKGEGILTGQRFTSNVEQFRDLMLLQLGADDAELAGDVGAAGADLVLAGDHVELVPGVAAVHNALGAQDHAVSALVQRVQGLVQILTAVFVGRLLAPAREHLVGVVVVVVMMPAGADTVLVVVVLMVMLVLVLVVVVMAAVVVVVIVIMVVMVMLMLVLIVVLVVMMVAAAVVVVLIVVVMVMMVVLVLILVGMGHVGGAGLGQQLGGRSSRW